MKKDNSLLIVIIVFLSVALGICGGILYTKIINNDQNNLQGNNTSNNSVSDNAENKADDVVENASFISFSGSTSQALILKDKTVNLNISQNENVTLFKMDNKEIINVESDCGVGGKYAVLGETLIIACHVGCDLGGVSVTAFNSSGSKLFEYEYLDETVPSMFIIDLDSVKLVNNEIIIDGSTSMHFEYNIKDTQTDKIYHIDVCNPYEDDTNNILNDNSIVRGQYKITYSNGTYSKPIRTKATTLKEDFNYYQTICSN